jgi:cysteinyl-tRNA synthetase
LCADFELAMDDDLAVPAALAALQGVVKEGNAALARDDREAARGAAGSVRAMLGVLGIDPFDRRWSVEASALAGVDQTVDALVVGLLEQRQRAREAKDFAAADAIRDHLAAVGIEIEDTAQGPRWSLAAGSWGVD